MAFMPTNPDDDRRRQITVPFLPQSMSGMGLGDVVKKVTDALHIPQCGGCRERQEYLNERATVRSLWED